MEQPDYGRSLAEIPGTVFDILGAEGEYSSIEGFSPAESENVVLVIVDGFGYNQWQEFDSGIFKEAEQNGDLTRITSVFPSMTAATLTSISTGRQPLQHSLVGWEMYYSEFGEKIQTLPFTDLSGTPLPDRFDAPGPEVLFEGSSAYADLGEEGVECYSVMDEGIAHGGFSGEVHSHSELVPYMNVPDMALKLRQKLESADGSSFFYVYMDEIDTTCHRYGPFSPQQDAQLESISDCLSRELGELSEDVAEDTTVVFTADHGQVEVSDYIDLYDHGIEEDLEVRNGDTISPCGTKRAVFLHLKDEREGSVRRKLSDLNLRIYTPDEAIDAGLFGDGEVSDRLRERVGDLLLVPEGREAVWYGDMDKTGVHGGMHENEMYVPFCAAKVSDIVD